MTRKRSKQKADPPITGVASGSLGTAANLDETQVLRTADLRAAAPEWFDDDEPEGVSPSDVVPPEELAVLQAAPNPGSTGKTEAGPVPAAVVRPRTPPREERTSARRPASARVPALAGLAALAILLLVAGVGFLSQLDLGSVGGPGGAPSGFSELGLATEAPASASPEPQGGKGHGNCKGKGHGGCD